MIAPDARGGKGFVRDKSTVWQGDSTARRPTQPIAAAQRGTRGAAFLTGGFTDSLIKS